MCVCVRGGPRVAGVYTLGKGERDNQGTEGQGAPDFRRGESVCLHLGSLSLLTTSPTRSVGEGWGSGCPLAPHLVRGSLPLEGWEC